MSFEALLVLSYKLTLVTVLALLLLRLLRHRPAAERAGLLRSAIAAVIVLPVASMVLPSLNYDVPAYFAPFIPVRDSADLFALFPRIGLEVLVGLYGLGATLLLARLAFGLLLLAKWTREAQPIACAKWRAVIDADAAAPVRVLVSDQLSTPLSFGLAHPVILIDRDTLAHSADAAAIVAHEMAHVRRRDWPALVLSRMVLALFWPNPLLWLLDRQLSEHSEEAADDEALEAVESMRYASALVACQRRACAALVPANGIATGTGLTRRIHRIINHLPPDNAQFSRWLPILVVAYLAATAVIAATVVCAEAARHVGKTAHGNGGVNSAPP